MGRLCAWLRSLVGEDQAAEDVDVAAATEEPVPAAPVSLGAVTVHRGPAVRRKNTYRAPYDTYSDTSRCYIDSMTNVRCYGVRNWPRYRAPTMVVDPRTPADLWPKLTWTSFCIGKFPVWRGDFICQIQDHLGLDNPYTITIIIGERAGFPARPPTYFSQVSSNAPVILSVHLRMFPMEWGECEALTLVMLGQYVGLRAIKMAAAVTSNEHGWPVQQNRNYALLLQEFAAAMMGGARG